MDLTSARFIKYSEINTDETDIYDDAWGFSSEFSDVFSCLELIDMIPSKEISDRLSGLIDRMV